MKAKSYWYPKTCAVIAASVLLSSGAVVFAAETTPKAGDVLRDTRQTERQIPERKAPNVTVEQTIKPPLEADKSLAVFVKSYRFSGQDVIAAEQLAGLLTNYTAKDMNLASLQQAADVIARHFQQQGYFVAQAYLPQQDISEGVVEIAVIIGRYGDLIIKNQTRVSDAVIRQQLRTLKPGAYIQTDQMERAALLAGDLTGVTVKTTLTPGKTPGTADVIVDVTPKGKDWQGMLSYDNYGSRLTGYRKATTNLSYNNPFRAGDKLSGTFTRTDNNQDTGDLTYQIPLAEGSNLTLRYSKVNYDLGEEYAGQGFSGTAYTKHADWTYALRRSRNANQYLQVGYDHKRLEDINTSETDNAVSRMVSLGLSGDAGDDLWGGGANAYSLMYYSGTTSSNVGAHGSWEKYTYSFMRQQNINGKLTAFLSISGQRATENLDGSEKFSLGGPYGVRAYPVSEGAGDEGYLTTAELRYTVPVREKGAMWQFSAFYDRGVSIIDKTSNDEGNRRVVSGMGLGVQYAKPADYAIRATYAWRIGSNESQADSHFGKSRLWLQAVKFF